MRRSVDCDHEMIGEKANDLLPFAKPDSMLGLTALKITEKLIRTPCSAVGPRRRQQSTRPEIPTLNQK